MKIRLVTFVLLFLTQFNWAQSVFDRGNEQYRKGNYQEAIAAYQSILKDKKTSSDLYFNLANAYYKLNQIGPAIYYYEKALLLNPNDKDVQNNLKFAKSKTVDDIKEIPKVGFEKVVHKATALFHFNTWAKLAVAFSFIFLGFFVGYYFSETTMVKRIYFTGLCIIPFLLALCFGAAWFEKDHYSTERPAIVFAESTPVVNEPQRDAAEVFVLHEGTKVFVLESLAPWKKIQLTDASEGWILSEAIRELK